MTKKDKTTIDQIRRNLNIAWGKAYDMNKSGRSCESLLSKIEEAQTRLDTMEENLNT